MCSTYMFTSAVTWFYLHNLRISNNAALLSPGTQTKGTAKSSGKAWTLIPAAVGLLKQRWDWDYGLVFSGQH